MEALKLEQGRPADMTGRLPKEIRVYDLLDSLGVSYIRVDHEAAMTIEACKDIDAALGTEICKNLFLSNRQQTEFYLLLIPGKKPLQTKYLSRQLGTARLSFAKGDFMERFLDITPGSASVLGLMNDQGNRVQLLIDEEVAKEAYLGCHPCINTSSLKISMADMLEKVIPAMGHAPRYVTLPYEGE